jgi:hypothetical protein
MAQLNIRDPRDELAAIAREDDYLDALVCALVARAVELGRTHLPSPGEQAEAQRARAGFTSPTLPSADFWTARASYS